MILTVFILALGIGAAVLATTRPLSVAVYNRQVQHDELVLSQAMDALIGRSVADANRPGSLPCPDTNDDGVAEIFAGSHCPSYIGRLPWRTLGLPDPRDASGERLWYALSSRFRDNSTAEPINTDTKVTPQVNVYLGNTATLLTNEPAAVIFAPGAVVGNQVRDAANKNNPVNYLESGSGWDNTSATGPYLIAQPSGTMNDRLRILTTAELMTPVERRAAQEILSLLAAYKAATAAGCNCYPWADFSDGISSPSGDRDKEGRVPLLGAVPVDWGSWGGSGNTPTVPSWLVNNMWWWVFHYTVAPADTEYHDPGTLTVDGVSGKSVVLITTGPAGAGRPAGSPGSWDDAWWSAYIEDSQNSDGGTVFVTPSSRAYARDRLYTIP